MILIVDDEADIRDSLVEFFADEGLPVKAAADGGAALASLERGELPWVIILDLLMPVLDGNERYKRMQANPRWSRVPAARRHGHEKTSQPHAPAQGGASPLPDDELLSSSSFAL